MEKIVEQGRLYDFYGELLTEHQKKVYEAAVYDDMSLAEIAETEGISRQGVHDLIRRVTGILQEYEDKLHMVARFDRISAHARELKKSAAQREAAGDADAQEVVFVRKAGKLADAILDDLL